MQEAHKYWIVKTKVNGEWYVHHQWLRNTQGLEVYTSEEAANKGLSERIEKLMSKGACPRCHFPSTISTGRALTHLQLIVTGKGGTLVKCNQCQTYWFLRPSRQAVAYAAAVADYVVEWCTRILKPSPEQYKALHAIGNIGNEDEQLYAAQVTLKDGSQHNYALVTLTMTPPTETNFNFSKNWHYLDQVTAITQSPYAYPHSIAKAIVKRQNLGQYDDLYLADRDGNNYRLAPAVGAFMPEGLLGKQLRLIKKSTTEFPFFIGVPNNYSEIEPEYSVYPQKTIFIFGDKH